MRATSPWRERQRRCSLTRIWSSQVALFLIHDVVYHIDLFHDLTPEMLAKLLTVLKPLQASPDEVMAVAGDVGREMYIIINGEMIEERPSDGAKSTLKAGEYFGELCVLVRFEP